MTPPQENLIVFDVPPNRPAATPEPESEQEEEQEVERAITPRIICSSLTKR